MTQPRSQRIILLCVLAYEALGCLLGGSLLIAAPDGNLMNMPVHIMHGAFADFLIPGIILFAQGILNGIAFYSVLRKNSLGWLFSWMALVGLAIWFTVEIAILHELVWLHYMWGLPVYLGLFAAIPLLPSRHATLREAMLIGGIGSSLLYVAMNIFVPLGWPEYNSASQTVSELSAIGAPTRAIWMWLGILYTLLIAGFGWGVWRSAEGNRPLRIAGVLIFIYAALGIFWPMASMHSREVLALGGGTFSDTMHLTLGGITEVLYLFALGFAAAAFGKSFRFYSIATFVAILVFAILTFMEAPGIAANQATPLIGVWERINIGLFLLWVVVLSVTLLQQQAAVYKVNRTPKAISFGHHAIRA